MGVPAMQSKPTSTVSFDKHHLPEHGGEPVIDRDVFSILEELADEDDPDLVAEIVPLPHPVATERMTQISKDADPDSIRGAAHALKSSSANIGALQFSEICAGLEAAARDDQLDKLEGLVTAALAMYEDVRSALAFSPDAND